MSLGDEEKAANTTIRFLEERTRRDPDDFGAQNRLAALYLKRLRETGNYGFLGLASSAAHASLAAVPAERNAGGLALLAMTENASHNFSAARDYAGRLMQLVPDQSLPYEILGDALLELGEYERAEDILLKMEQLGSRTVNTETRLARFAILRGDHVLAKQKFTTALALALDLSPPQREVVAWCHWQLGEKMFSSGNYEAAEKHYRDALTTFPDYHLALASLGRARAARGDLSGAIEHYKHAIQIFPDPTFFAALGDLYKLTGREKNAAAQYTLVEKIEHLSVLNGALYNRQLAMFYADHDLKAEEAYTNASKEYTIRQDIYGADAVAWTALKAGKLPEAHKAIRQALRLGTQDAKLLYHAGMIARAGGEQSSARDYLNHALALNPQFDLLQAAIAKRALQDLG